MRREPKSFSQASSSFLALQLRLFSFIQLGTGIAFIAIACVLLWPPAGSGFVVCLWAIGILAILAGIIGFIAAHEKSIACCLSPYITLTGLVLAAKTGLLLYLFISPSKAVDSIVEAWTKSNADDPTPPSPPYDKIHSSIYIGRWVLLGLFTLQLLAIFIALLLRCCAKRAAEKQNNKYQPFVEDLESCYNARTAEANAKLAQMKADLVAAQTLKKNKAGAAYTTEMITTASRQTNSNVANIPDTIAPYRPSAGANATGRNTSLPPRPAPSRSYSVPAAGEARGGYARAGTRGVAGGHPHTSTTHHRSPLGPSASLPAPHASATAPSASVQQSTSTRDSFKPTWASKAAGGNS